nr:hypothetical protein HmN_000122800 [Hymenolepis microstoma]
MVMKSILSLASHASASTPTPSTSLHSSPPHPHPTPNPPPPQTLHVIETQVCSNLISLIPFHSTRSTQRWRRLSNSGVAAGAGKKIDD